MNKIIAFISLAFWLFIVGITYAQNPQFTGLMDVPIDGEYTFYTTSDEGSKLYIGNTEVVNNDGVHSPQERSGKIGLKEMRML